MLLDQSLSMSDLATDPEPENEEYVTFPSDGSTVFFDDPTTKVTSMCSLSNMLFIGTNRGTVSQYILQECEYDETTFSYVELLARTITDTDVLRMDACTELSLLAILSNTILFVCDAEQLEMVNFFPTCRGVACFQLCSDGPQSAKLCLAFHTRFIQIYRLTSTTAVPMFEFKLSVSPISLCIGENFLCIATDEGSYVSVDLHTKAITNLFIYDRQHNTKPFLVRVAKDEFLISGPGSLGVIVDANGTSKRPPLQLSPNVLDAFVWKDYVFSLTDEFFTIHSIFTQNQIQTVLLPNATAVCFSRHNPHLLFVALTSKANGRVDILAIGPERWDRFARKLILADCLPQAQQLLETEQQRIDGICQARPASSRHEQQVFITRSRRVHGVLGFYCFEQGDFRRAGPYFEQARIDIRELLCRYDELLPNGFTFAPNWFYNTSCQKPNDDWTSTIRHVTELCLSHSLNPEGKPNMNANLTWSVRYEEFLFSFLQKHHKSKFTEKHLHLLETALVKLYLKLLRHGVNPPITESIFPSNRFVPSGLAPSSADERRASDLINLISSLVHLDVDDLIGYLKRSSEHHALALLYQWQGNVTGALSLWEKLAYGELVDENFPGVDFYVAVLSWLASPNAEPIKLWSTSQLEQNDSAQSSEPSVYVELVWQHFCRSLEHSTEISEKLLRTLPYTPGECITLGDDILLNGSDSTTSEVSLAPSQCLNPTHILRKLIPRHMELGIEYLRQLIYVNHDVTPQYHTLLARLYLEVLVKKLNDEPSTDSQARIVQLRRDFCYFLRYSNNYCISKLLEQVMRSGEREKLAYELAILYGKSNQHREALHVLVNQLSDLPAALCYCLSYANEDKARLVTDGDGERSAVPDTKRRLPPASVEPLEGSDLIERAPEVFTILVELCLKRKAEKQYEQLAMDLLNSPNVPLQFSKVLSFLPADIPLTQVNGFLLRAFHSVTTLTAANQLHCGLVKSCARLSATAVSSHVCPKLVVDKDTRCSRCHENLIAYGPDSPFAWLLQRKQFVHVHCL